MCVQVLVDEDSHLQKQLKPSKRQRDLEHLARTYLHDIGKNVSKAIRRITFLYMLNQTGVHRDVLMDVVVCVWYSTISTGVGVCCSVLSSGDIVPICLQY